jgi:hypothetical protein
MHPLAVASLQPHPLTCMPRSAQSCLLLLVCLSRVPASSKARLTFTSTDSPSLQQQQQQQQQQHMLTSDFVVWQIFTVMARLTFTSTDSPSLQQQQQKQQQAAAAAHVDIRFFGVEDPDCHGKAHLHLNRQPQPTAAAAAAAHVDIRFCGVEDPDCHGKAHLHLNRQAQPYAAAAAAAAAHAQMAKSKCGCSRSCKDILAAVLQTDGNAPPVNY